MSYRDYLATTLDLTVRKSDIESHASGLAIGRLEVWPPGSALGQDIALLIENSGLDLVIVRAGAQDVELAAKLNSRSLISWQADTLLYFKIEARSLAEGAETTCLEPLMSRDESIANALVERVFEGYRNHYSANPALGNIDVVKVYQDWTLNALRKDKNTVFTAVTSNGATAGLCVVDSEGDKYEEILLAGIVPEERGHGVYQEMIRSIGHNAHKSGKDSVVISTQASNIRVMRSWCRMGFLPTIALNTFHVMRRDKH